MPKRLTFVFPMPAALTNRRSSNHWRVVHNERQQYKATLDALLGAGRLPDPPAEPFTSALIRSVMHLGNAMDDDNALARHKPIMDWLKTRGYIMDDRRKCVKWEGLPEQIVRRTREYRIELTLTPITG